MSVVPSPDLHVYVHIGAPKAGSTFVQNALWSQRARLEEEGVLYPYSRPTEHFEAMLDLRERGWGGIRADQIAGSWDRVAARVRRWDGHTAILTSELLGAANKNQISRLVESVAPARVTVIYTARDLARQLVSSWQEQIKHNLAVTLEDFLAEMLRHGHETRPPFARQFWPLQDAAHVLSRWSALVGDDHIRLVTVPPPGAPMDLLWERFCSVIDLKVDHGAVDTSSRNIALSLAEAEFFRRVNTGTGDMPPRDYSAVVRSYLMRQVATSQGDRLALPERVLPAVEQRSRELVEALHESGYPVAGDLEELVPDASDHLGSPTPEDVTDAQLMPLAMQSIDLLLRSVCEQRTRLHAMHDRPTATPRLRSRARAALRRSAGRLKRTAATVRSGRA